MIKSMTGFGRANLETPDFKIDVEIRAVNHRFCEVSMRLPRILSPLEGQVRTLLQSNISRGKINLTINFESYVEQNAKLILNEDLLEAYTSVIARIQTKLSVRGEYDLVSLLQIPDLIERSSAESDAETLWPSVEKAITQAIHDFDRMRDAEGLHLTEDLTNRTHIISQLLNEIKTVSSTQLVGATEKMRERIRQLLGDIAIDETRLAMEVAILADKLDITEECVRLQIHCQQFLNYLQDKDPAGRRLNFLLQEMNREANTIASKANNAGIAQTVIRIKEELERIREQVQNVE